MSLGSAAIAVLALTYIGSAAVLLSENFDTRTLVAQLPDTFANSLKNSDNSVPGGVYLWYSQPSMETITITGPTGTNANQSASINYAASSANDSTTSIILGC